MRIQIPRALCRQARCRPAWRAALVPAAVAVVIGQLALAGPASATRVGDGSAKTSQASAAIAPKAVNELDCNGWSPKYKSVRPAMRGLCTDPVLAQAGQEGGGSSTMAGMSDMTSRASNSSRNAAGSANTMTYF